MWSVLSIIFWIFFMSQSCLVIRRDCKELYCIGIDFFIINGDEAFSQIGLCCAHYHMRSSRTPKIRDTRVTSGWALPLHTASSEPEQAPLTSTNGDQYWGWEVGGAGGWHFYTGTSAVHIINKETNRMNIIWNDGVLLTSLTFWYTLPLQRLPQTT